MRSRRFCGYTNEVTTNSRHVMTFRKMQLIVVFSNLARRFSVLIVQLSDHCRSETQTPNVFVKYHYEGHTYSDTTLTDIEWSFFVVSFHVLLLWLRWRTAWCPNAFRRGIATVSYPNFCPLCESSIVCFKNESRCVNTNFLRFSFFFVRSCSGLLKS